MGGVPGMRLGKGTRSTPARAVLAGLLFGLIAFQAAAFAGADDSRQSSEQGRDIVFALDASGSMQLAKFDSVKYAFENMSRALQPSDRFTVFTFSAPPDWWIDMWSETLQPATAESAAAARGFVDNSGTSGSSNIVSAMERAFSRFDGGLDRSRFVLLVSDGRASSGLTVTDQVIKRVAADDNVGACVFAAPVGQDADYGLLRGVAEANGGRLLDLAGAATELPSLSCARQAVDPPQGAPALPVASVPLKPTQVRPVVPAGFRVSTAAPAQAAPPPASEPALALSLVAAAGAFVMMWTVPSALRVFRRG